MRLPEYLEIQFGWVKQHGYAAGHSESLPVKAVDSTSAYRMILVNSGQLEVRVGERGWQLPSGSVMLLPSQVILENRTWSAIEDCRFITIGFRLLLFGSTSIVSLIQQVSVWHPSSKEFDLLTALADVLHGMDTRPDTPRRFLRDGAMNTMLGLCWDAFGMEAILDRVHPNVPSWLSLIMEHIRHNPAMNVNELAHVAGFTNAYFYRLFEEHVGMSPSAYLKQHRIDLAKHLLATTEMNVTEIATHLGFANPSDFSRYFRRLCQVTPSDYRMMSSQQK